MIGAIVTATAAVGAAAETESSPATRIDARPQSCRRGTDVSRTDGGTA
ncbi:hypothetical protein HTG_14405 [Natrinema mahii]|nr:hypothetical protein HTG_14405 [Natrinema mahii]